MRQRILFLPFLRKLEYKEKWSYSGSLLVSVTLASDLCMYVCSVLTLCDPMDCSLPGSSVHGIFQARILEWVAIFSSRGSSQPKDQTRPSCSSCTGRQILYQWATGKPGLRRRRFQFLKPTALEILCIPFMYLYLNPWQLLNFLTVSTALSFSEYHIVGLIG